jgi:uncharacterized protein
MSRRFFIYVIAVFAITWGAWWTLVALAHNDVVSYGQWPFMTLYILGGFGPLIASYISVIATREVSPLREFHRRFFRWRVSSVWYVIAFMLPIALAVAAFESGGIIDPTLLHPISAWYTFFLFFAITLIAGGLEEPGWRGVAQEELQKTLPPFIASIVVALFWAPWHLPLFFLSGVPQNGGNFAIFAVGVLGNSLLLGWLYSRTQSVLLCMIFHAAANAAALMGVGLPSSNGSISLIAPVLQCAIGVLLFVRRPERTIAN